MKTSSLVKFALIALVGKLIPGFVFWIFFYVLACKYCYRLMNEFDGLRDVEFPWYIDSADFAASPFTFVIYICFKPGFNKFLGEKISKFALTKDKTEV